MKPKKIKEMRIVDVADPGDQSNPYPHWELEITTEDGSRFLSGTLLELSDAYDYDGT